MLDISVLTFTFLTLLSRCEYVITDSRFHKEPLFGIVTPYFWERDPAERISRNEYDEILYDGNYYDLVYVDGMIRHSARYPSAPWLQRFDEVHKYLKTLENTARSIKEWRNPFTIEQEYQISELGKNAMFIFGNRVGKYFHSFLKNKMDKTSFYVSEKKRTKDSARDFHESLLDSLQENGDRHSLTLIVNNTMLRFDDECPRYEDVVRSNETALLEIKKFKEGPQMASVISGIAGDDNLTFGQVETMQQLCAFELAVYNKSDWCTYFTESSLEVFEYLNDIVDYTLKGYAHEFNYEMSCPLFEHIFRQMDAAIDMKGNASRGGYRAGTFRFGHSDGVTPMYPVLGLFRDEEPLRADNFDTQTNRKWKSSHITPFSANVMFLLYKSKNNGVKPEYVVSTLVNEEPVVPVGCDMYRGKATCPYQTLRKSIKSYIDNCNFQEMCQVTDGNDSSDANTVVKSTIGALVVILLTVFLVCF